MSEDGMLAIKVPASSANLGPGFDSIGLALNLYLTLEAEKSDSFEIIPLSEDIKAFPADEKNLIFQTAIKTASLFKQDMPPCRVKVKNEIPPARGLGSSAAAIVAGIELADACCKLGLSKQQKLEIAANIEGHPDNVGASLFGGLVVGSQLENDINLAVFSDVHFDVVVAVPQEELLTKASRGVLPDMLPFAEAVKASGVANLLVASLLSDNWELAGKMMSYDRFHQPYRRNLVPHMEPIETVAKEYGAFGSALSGAGPAVICFAAAGKGEQLSGGLKAAFPGMDVVNLKIDRSGSNVAVNKLDRTM